MGAFITVVLAALVTGIAVAPASVTADPAWSSAVDLSAAGQSAYGPQVAMSTDGRYQTITWQRSNGSNYIIQARTSSDYGATWSTAVDLSGTGANATEPQVAMSSDGRYQTITWQRSNGSNDIIQASTSSDYGATWATAVDLSATGANALYPQIAMSSDGRYQTITWYRYNGSKDIVQSRTSSNYGASWATALDQSATLQHAYEPQVAVSSDGRYQTITWKRSNGSNTIIQSRTSSDYGTTWSTATDLSVTGQNADIPRVAMSSDGRYQTITWRRSNGSNTIIQASTSSDYGTTWGAAADLSDTGQTARNPQVAMSSDGRYQTITWYRSNGSNYIIQARTSSDYGTTWSTAAEPSATGQNALDPQIAMSSDGRYQTITWYRSNGTNTIVQASTWANPAAETSSTTARATFRFVLADGTECTAISPQVVIVGTMVTLPTADANCRTMPGSTVAGWTIPTPPGSTEYGSPTTPFGPGLSVRVVDSQTFTLVPFEPILTFVYDANVAAADSCTSNNVENTTATGRRNHVWVPRHDVTIARFPTRAACTPPGHTLTGWNTRGDGTGTSYRLDETLPSTWATDSVNERTLFAVWK